MAFGLVGKHPNRWFKVCIMSCQICKKRLPELTSLGRRRGRFHVNRPERIILGDKGMSSDHLGVCFVNFDGHMRH
jgi:hypothetical protein